jgi:glycosyltransferase involved in cell wall biosynthesis
MWHGQIVSLVLPTYNERDSIFHTIAEFDATGVVDEMIVVNNNAAPGTSEEVGRTSAREVHEPQQGYGFAIQRGLREARGDYVVIAEPDGTFAARDVFKLLAYAEDFDVVYGSRTARTLIWDGANMDGPLRWGNWALAKVMELLFNAPNLTDVGCTLRLVRRGAAARMAPYFRVGGNHFGPEMMLLSLVHGLRVVQVPVNYLPRVGVSSVTGDRAKAMRLGMVMGLLVLQFRLGRWFSRAPRFGHIRSPHGLPAAVGRRG